MELVGRATYSFTARKRIDEVIAKEKIDVVYLLYIVNYISPSVIDGAHRMHVPVVMRLSDFSLLCPNYIFYRYQDKQVCEECAQYGLQRGFGTPLLEELLARDCSSGNIHGRSYD